MSLFEQKYGPDLTTRKGRRQHRRDARHRHLFALNKVERQAMDDPAPPEPRCPECDWTLGTDGLCRQRRCPCHTEEGMAERENRRGYGWFTHPNNRED